MVEGKYLWVEGDFTDSGPGWELDWQTNLDGFIVSAGINFLFGGEKKMVYNAEFHVPLLKSQGLEGVVFFDAGNVFAESEPVTFNDIPSSYGLGVRWYSPVGPLRLEYGWKVDPQPGESRGEWIFTVGGGF